MTDLVQGRRYVCLCLSLCSFKHVQITGNDTDLWLASSGAGSATHWLGDFGQMTQSPSVTQLQNRENPDPDLTELFLKRLFFIWLHSTMCGLFVPLPGIEPGPWQWKLRVLTTGPWGDCLTELFWRLNKREGWMKKGIAQCLAYNKH